MASVSMWFNHDVCCDTQILFGVIKKFIIKYQQKVGNVFNFFLIAYCYEFDDKIFIWWLYFPKHNAHIRWDKHRALIRNDVNQYT